MNVYVSVSIYLYIQGVFVIVIALLIYFFFPVVCDYAAIETQLENERVAHIQFLREEREILRREREHHAHALTEAKLTFEAKLNEAQQRVAALEAKLNDERVQAQQRVAALEKELKETRKRLENKQEKLVDALAKLKRAPADSDSEDVKPVVKKEKK